MSELLLSTKIIANSLKQKNPTLAASLAATLAASLAATLAVYFAALSGFSLKVDGSLLPSSLSSTVL